MVKEMNKDEIVSGLIDSLYIRDGCCKASVATIKDLINKISKTHLYCKSETAKSKLRKRSQT
jgi:hypothetical protein